MEITILNRTAHEFPDLVLKYYWFATEPGGKILSILRADEKPISIKASASSKIETKEVTIAFTAKKTQVVNGKNTSVPATGYKYAGYGVRIVDKDNKILTQKFDPPELLKNVDSVAVVPEKK